MPALRQTLPRGKKRQTTRLSPVGQDAKKGPLSSTAPPSLRPDTTRFLGSP
ncbi:hypothetical protein LI328DRAFT_83984 [Trichoderma asperelloides]|nr:hypothetical protein LI328DRAFT_83984 [Trichoderma asperelloides]